MVNCEFFCWSKSQIKSWIKTKLSSPHRDPSKNFLFIFNWFQTNFKNPLGREKRVMVCSLENAPRTDNKQLFYDLTFAWQPGVDFLFTKRIAKLCELHTVIISLFTNFSFLNSLLVLTNSTPGYEVGSVSSERRITLAVRRFSLFNVFAENISLSLTLWVICRSNLGISCGFWATTAFVVF